MCHLFVYTCVFGSKVANRLRTFDQSRGTFDPATTVPHAAEIQTLARHRTRIAIRPRMNASDAKGRVKEMLHWQKKAWYMHTESEHNAVPSKSGDLLEENDDDEEEEEEEH